MTNPKHAKECADRLQALAEPNRIRIIDCLLTGEKNVTQLAKALGVEIVNVSHHLGVLRHAKVATATKRGRFVVYALNPAATIEQSEGKAEYSVNLGCCRLLLPEPPAESA